MNITVHLSGYLKPFTGGEVEVALAGEFTTVGGVRRLEDEIGAPLFDRIGHRAVLTETGDIRQHVNVFAGSDDVKRINGLETRVKSGDIHIFNAVSGG